MAFCVVPKGKHVPVGNQSYDRGLPTAGVQINIGVRISNCYSGVMTRGNYFEGHFLYYGGVNYAIWEDVAHTKFASRVVVVEVVDRILHCCSHAVGYFRW